MGRLTDKVTVVTGAGAGIGRAIATTCHAEGAIVIVTDLDGAAAADTAAQLGDRAIPHAVDVTDRASVQTMVSGVVTAYGRIDVLVNNAGWDQAIPFVQSEPDFWAKVIAVNYVGVLHTCREILPVMIEAGGGHVVNLGSDAGRVGSSGEAVYSGARARSSPSPRPSPGRWPGTASMSMSSAPVPPTPRCSTRSAATTPSCARAWPAPSRSGGWPHQRISLRPWPSSPPTRRATSPARR